MEQDTPEQQPKPETPKIYVASLSDYNDGRLHGRWIEANQEPEQLHQSVQDMLKTSPMPLAEEWAIHDYEGFGSVYLSEHESLETIARLAKGVEEHGVSFAAWVAYRGLADEQAPELFNEAFLGRYDTLRDYANQFAAELGLIERFVPNWARTYLQVDVDQLSRDLAASLVVIDDSEGGIFVFDPSV